MKYLSVLFCLISLLVACRHEDPAVTRPDSLVGTWQVSETVGTFYTDQTLIDKQVQKGSSSEKYQFFANGTFELHQGDAMFFVHGQWQLNPATHQLTLLTAKGETLYWTVNKIEAGRLELSYEQKIPFNEHTQRLEVKTTCIR